MTELLRAVFDTNVFVSAFLSRNPTSPTKELIQRWLNAELTLLVSDALVDEVIEKLQAKGVRQDRILDLMTSLSQLCEWIDVPPDAVRPMIQADPDDNHILACAVVGKADYLVTYDPHFEVLGSTYQGIKITKALPFLWRLRGDRPPGEK